MLMQESAHIIVHQPQRHCGVKGGEVGSYSLTLLQCKIQRKKILTCHMVQLTQVCGIVSSFLDGGQRRIKGGPKVVANMLKNKCMSVCLYRTLHHYKLVMAFCVVEIRHGPRTVGHTQPVKLFNLPTELEESILIFRKSCNSCI